MKKSSLRNKSLLGINKSALILSAIVLTQGAFVATDDSHTQISRNISSEPSSQTDDQVQKMTIGTLLNSSSSKIREYLDEQFEKSTIETRIKYNKDFTLGKTYDHIEVGYHPKLEPAYIKGLQLRQDEFYLNLSAGIPVGQLGLSDTINAKVTFARTFENKYEAIKGQFYSIDRFPKNSQVALEKLKEGDIARLDISNDGALGIGKGTGSEKINAYASGSVTKGSRFILDVYRLPKDKDGKRFARLRLIFLDHDALLNIGAGINTIDLLAKTAFWQKWLASKLLGIDWPSCNFSLQYENILPMQTALADFVINLDDANGKLAYDSILSNIMSKKLTRFLNPLTSIESASGKISEVTSVADEMAQEEHQLTKLNLSHKIAVERLFKGNVKTNQFGKSGECKAGIRFFSGKTKSSEIQATSTVLGTDSDGNQIAMNYESNIQSNDGTTSFLISQNRNQGQSQMEIVSLAKTVPDNDGNLQYIPNHLTDLVFSKEIRKTAFQEDTFEKLKTYLEYAVPELANDVEWKNLDNRNLTNGYIRFSFSFNQESLNYLTRIPNLYEKIYDLTKSFPYKDDVPALNQGTGAEGVQAEYLKENKYFLDLEQILRALNNVNDSSRPLTDRIKLLQDASMIPIFKVIAPALIASSIPSGELKKLVQLRISAGADKAPVVNHNTDFPLGSNAYLSIKNMMSVIYDQSFDLRLQYDVNSKGYKLQKFPNGPIVTEACKDCIEVKNQITSDLQSFDQSGAQ